MENSLYQLIQRRRHGIPAGIGSFCTAHPLVLEACMEQTLQYGGDLLIEATANQVNQFGGYTGMCPADFRDLVFSIADTLDFPKNRIILGGDHLGPLVWKDLPEPDAMANAVELVRTFVSAGYQKIHLDTSMRLADDPLDAPLTDETIARRGAILFQACETAFETLRQEHPDACPPVYIIGSEVPIPGGAQGPEDSLMITRPEALLRTVTAYRNAFAQHGWSHHMDRIIGIVVQPGVEFGNDDIHRYDRKAARSLTQAAARLPGIVLEGHSTDYQPASLLREMVEDGIAILKVGPALTFSLREGLFALSRIECELIPESQQTHLIEILDQLMANNPSHWEHHYFGTEQELRIKRRYSYSDRCRYYFSHPHFRSAVENLFHNLEKADIPMSLLHQYLPVQYYKVRDGQLPLNPRALVKDCVAELVSDYQYAVYPQTRCR